MKILENGHEHHKYRPDKCCTNFIWIATHQRPAVGRSIPYQVLYHAYTENNQLISIYKSLEHMIPHGLKLLHRLDKQVHSTH